MITTLGLSDNLQVVMWIIGLLVVVGQFVFNVVIGLTITTMNRKTHKIDNLETEVKQQASDMVDAKIRTFVTEFRGMVDQLKLLIGQQEKRLERGDRDFDRLEEAAAKSDGKIVVELAKLKDWMHATFATKGDVERLANQVDRQARKECDHR